ncbi:MAG: P-loop NTPase [Simkaniaceae bacterium]|nr:P-loop NTPase [Simkaniaceae bacterium]
MAPLEMYAGLRHHRKGDGASSVRRTIAVVGGKGGVGKSTVTVNVALALKRLGLRVGILDADIYGPSVSHLLGGHKTFPETLEKGSISPAISPEATLSLPFISITFFQGDYTPSIVRAPIANGLVDRFLTQVEWGELDMLLVDFPPGTGDIQITLMQKAAFTGALIVTTPQEVALLDVEKSMEMCRRMEVPLLGIVENMGYFPCGKELFFPLGKGGGRRLADETEVPLLGTIPLDSAIARTGDEGRSLFDTDSDAASSFEEVARRLLARADAYTGERGPDFALSDCYHIAVAEGDGRKRLFRLSDLQARCPCVRCVTKAASGKPEVDPEVRAEEVRRVGQYGIAIRFTTGCSAGVYSFAYLRSQKGVGEEI